MPNDDSIYVVLQPHSASNHSDKYRVVAAEDWAAYINGARKSVAVAGEHDTYAAAEHHRDQLNGVTDA